MKYISAGANVNYIKPAPGGTKINVLAAGSNAGSNFETIKSEISDIDGKYYIKDNSQILSDIVRRRTSLEKTYKSNCYLSTSIITKDGRLVKKDCIVNEKKLNNYESSGTKTMMLRLNAKKQNK